MEMIADFLDMLRRRLWLIVTVVAVGLVVSLYFALQAPRTYEATEVIQIEQPAISSDLAPAASGTASARRIQLIQQRLFTRDMVLEIGNAMGVFDGTPGMADSDRVTLMRNAVTIQGVAAAREGYSDDGTLSVLSVNARMDSPDLAQRVAHEFARRTLELSADQRLQEAKQTLDFFTVQEKNLTDEITTLENERETFRKSSLLSIPGMVDYQRTEITTINTTLLDIEQKIITAQSDITRLSAGNRISAVEQRQIDDAKTQLAALTDQQAALIAKRTDLEAAIARAPDAERQLADYDRKLEDLRTQLHTITGKRREAETNYALEERDQGGRMTVIEPAVRPDYPVSSGRRKVALMGLMATLGGALGLAFLLDLLNPVIRTANQMERRVGLRPVVSIPNLTKPRRRGLFGRRRSGGPRQNPLA